jgi:1-deoxy-D-xylulose-5-phosphate reductoisomerase
MKKKKRIAILGSTGSIGQNAVRIIREHSDALELVGIAGGSRVEPLAQIAHEFGVREVALFNPGNATPSAIASAFPDDCKLSYGMEGLTKIASLESVDIVLIAVVGTTALEACVAAIECGKTIALASKEILVMAGEFIMPLVEKHQARLLPTDSEHNAIFQCLEGYEHRHVTKILLTASGGRYLHADTADLAKITPEEAVQHPNWNMGKKISIDSSTMANKGLEVIEARWLFGLEPDQIEVVIHPQSLIHSMVQFVDGSILAQMSPPNMSFAIQHCLFYPDRRSGVDEPMDFSQAFSMDFKPPDFGRFPCLKLAFDALRTGGCAPAVFNAANEVAVAAFIENQISYLDIPRVIEFTLGNMSLTPPASIADIQSTDREARQVATRWYNT